MEALRRTGHQGIDVALMEGSGRPAEGPQVTDYEGIAAKVNKRRLAPSHLFQFFIYSLRSPENVSEKVLSDRFFASRMGVQRDTLNIGVALIEARESLISGRNPEEVKTVLERLAPRTDLLSYPAKEGCTRKDVMAVEIALIEGLAGAEQQALATDSPALEPVRRKAWEGRERMQRRQMFQVRREPLIFKWFNDLAFALSAASLANNQDTLVRSLVNNLSSAQYVDPETTPPGGNTRGVLRTVIDDPMLRQFRFLKPSQRAGILDAAENKAERIVAGSENDLLLMRVRQAYSNILDLIPPRDVAATISAVSEEKAAVLVEMMSPERAAKMFDSIVNGDDRSLIRKAQRIYSLIHPEATYDILKRMSMKARVKIPN